MSEKSKFDDLDIDLSELGLEEEEEEELDSSVQAIIDNKELKWIFVGGKGGVGKTTVSASLSLLLTKYRKDVLLISTDPAHSLSDIFMQKFSDIPIKVKGTNNLSVMEMSPKKVRKLTDEMSEIIPKDLIKDFGSMPGMDEVGTIIEIMRQVESFNFDCVVFDTAPTGHTLKLLSFPSILEKGYSKYFGFFQSVTKFLKVDEKDFTKSQTSVNELTKQFKNPRITTFVCVCIPSFLSVYETERLVQELVKSKMDISHIIVNQCILEKYSVHCKLCKSRFNIQKKYLDQIQQLYKGFHVIQIPLFEEEIKSVEKLKTLFEYFEK